MSSNTPSFILSVDLHTELVIVQLLDCDGNLIKEYPASINGVNFFNNIFNWQLTECLDPCACYKFKVKSKNYCSDVWYEKTFDWNRSTSFQYGSINNVINVGGILNNQFCVQAYGTKSLNITIFDRWGLQVFSNNGAYTCNPMCFTLPTDLSCGTYYYIVDFVDCAGITHTVRGSLTIMGNCNSSTGFASSNDGFDFAQNTQFIENGVADSLYSLLSPNPVTDNSIITYHLPEGGHVKISVCNSNFEQLSVLLNEDKLNGDFTTTVSAANLPLGPNYYMIEFVGTKTARLIKRFSVIH